MLMAVRSKRRFLVPDLTLLSRSSTSTPLDGEGFRLESQMRRESSLNVEPGRAMGSSNTPTLRLNLNVDEAAAALRVSPRMVRNLIARRKVKAHRIGRRVLVSVEALAAFVRDREAEASA